MISGNSWQAAFGFQFIQGEGKQKKGHHCPNDRPHRPLVLYSICLMTMVTLMKYSLNSRQNFEKKKRIKGLYYATIIIPTYLPI